MFEKLPCSEMTFCAILSNVLENAMHAVRKQSSQDRRVYLSIFERSGHLLMLEKNPSVDAIVARYDELAAVALSVARRIGRKVPDDLVVTGFDNDFISNYVSPALTTVEIRKEEVAKSAMEALLALIRNEKTDKNISITARLIIRDSTKQ